MIICFHSPGRLLHVTEIYLFLRTRKRDGGVQWYPRLYIKRYIFTVQVISQTRLDNEIATNVDRFIRSPEYRPSWFNKIAQLASDIGVF